MVMGGRSGVTRVGKFLLSRIKRLLAAVVVSVVLAAGFVALLQMGHVAEPAVLNPHPSIVISGASTKEVVA
jgi:peptidoglycan/LPS O-acetylase OafA/YrhL